MKIFAASAGGLRPKDTRGQFFLPKEGGFGAISVSSARGFLSGRSALKYKRENRNFVYQTFLFRFLGFCLFCGFDLARANRHVWQLHDDFDGVFPEMSIPLAPSCTIFLSLSWLI